MRRTIFTFVPFLFLAALVSAQVGSGKPICQGEYSDVGTAANQKPTSVKMDHWQMYAGPDNSYSVAIDMVSKDGQISERLFLGEGLKPKGFKLDASSGPGDRDSINVSCKFDEKEIACSATFNGSTSSATFRSSPPYVFMPPIADAPSFDFPWFFQGLASQAVRSNSHITDIPEIEVQDGDTENTIKLHIAEIERVQYLGREKLKLGSQEIDAHRFRLFTGESAPKSDDINIWISESGLLLKLDDQQAGSMILTKYDGPPL